MNSNNLSYITIIAFRVLLQAVLLFIMISCIFGFAASFEYPGINRYQLLYTAILGVLTVLFVKLGTNEAHKKLSYYMALLTTLLWLIVILHEL
jgi:hypothetical protein